MYGDYLIMAWDLRNTIKPEVLKSVCSAYM